jgi:SAM-dependent methyltransferase
MATTFAAASYGVGIDERLPSYRVDTRDAPPDVFVDLGDTDWSRLEWCQVGRPYRVEKWAAEKLAWEEEHDEPMPVKESWICFNRHFHELFQTDCPEALARARADVIAAAAHADIAGAAHTVKHLVQLACWNKVHRIEDAVWDPRGKRALFEGLKLDRPRILYLGAADGYEAMQLLAMYPGGHAVLVDYDDFCRTDRFGKFPEAYPFLGVDPASGHRRVWYREEMSIDFEVADIRDLRCGREFDVILSVGLIEHFPDVHKPYVFELHRRFLKPGGVIIMTTPRDQISGRAFYTIMADYMNYGYRELMDVRQLGLYAHDNGLCVRRAGYIKAHNGIVCSLRSPRP